MKLLRDKAENSSEEPIINILDVGGLEEYWINMGLDNHINVHITILNLTAQPTKCSNINSVAGDATNLKEYKRDSFDVVFSNSVIEHLYNFQNQSKMSSEAIRVGKHFFVQTPNKHFFIEPHYLLPFFQYLPKRFRLFILTSTILSRGKKWAYSDATQYLDEIRLISRNEMKLLFPSSNIYEESFLGLTKSFTAHNFESSQN